MRYFLTALFTLALAVSVSAQKKVLIEHFSNASCSICGVYSPQVFAFAEQNKDNVLVLSYHTPFPYLHDSLHFENPADANARISYYGVSGTPYSIMEGSFYKGASASVVGNLSTKTTERLNATPTAVPQVQITDLKIENGMATATVVFISTDDIKNFDLRGHVALVERVVPKTAYLASPGSNSEQEYKNVMRRMYMPQSGFTLQNKGISTGDTLKVSFATNTVKNLNQVRILAFIQNHSTKEIYQANAVDAQNTATSVAPINTTTATWAYDAQNNQVAVSFSSPTTGSITITDIAGRVMVTQEIANSTYYQIPVNQLRGGIYIATYSGQNTQTATKIRVY